MISSISSHIPSGDLMAQAVSEHQNHDRPQDIKARSQSALGASNDVNILQTFQWLGCLILQIAAEREEQVIKGYSQPGLDDISKDITKDITEGGVPAAIRKLIMASIMAG